MRHWFLAARAVPVLLPRIRRHRVVQLDSLRFLSSHLDPALTLDDVQQLASRVRVPVVSGTGLEPHDRGEDGPRLRGLHEPSQSCPAGEMLSFRGLFGFQRFGPRCDLHAFSLIPTDFAPLYPTEL